MNIYLYSEDNPGLSALELIVKKILPQSDIVFSIVTYGFGKIKANLKKYNNLAKNPDTLVIVLTDLDTAECAPAKMDDWITFN